MYNQNNTWWSQSDWRFDGSTEILDLNEYKLLHIDFSQDTIFDASKHSRSFVENTIGHPKVDDDVNNMREISPSNYVKNIKAPILLMCT